jgi:hypothetical protein
VSLILDVVAQFVFQFGTDLEGDHEDYSNALLIIFYYEVSQCD